MWQADYLTGQLRSRSCAWFLLRIFPFLSFPFPANAFTVVIYLNLASLKLFLNLRFIILTPEVLGCYLPLWLSLTLPGFLIRFAFFSYVQAK